MRNLAERGIPKVAPKYLVALKHSSSVTKPQVLSTFLC